MSLYLGQFTDENAARIAAVFDEQSIGWSAKTSGRLGRLLFAADWGVRLFVAEDDADRAWAIATELAPDGVARRPPA